MDQSDHAQTLPKSATNGEGQDPARDTLLVSNTTPLSQGEQETCHCKPDQTPGWKMALEFAAVVVGIVVAIIYGGQLSQMIESNRLTRESYKLDERAWVAVTSVNGTGLEAGKKFTYSVHFVDTGKTPARNVVIHPGDELAPRGQTPNLSVEMGAVRLGVLSPSSERTYDNGPIPPTRNIQTMMKEDLDVLRTKTLYVHGKITYDDIFGCHHWIAYCAYLKDDWSGYAFCSEGNDTDLQDRHCLGT
jgi:hypothetical protein